MWDLVCGYAIAGGWCGAGQGEGKAAGRRVWTACAAEAEVRGADWWVGWGLRGGHLDMYDCAIMCS